MNGNLAKTERQGKKTARSFKSIDLVMGLMAAGSIIAITKGFLRMGSEMEQLRTKIAVFERGFKNVDNVMAELNKQFGKTPFSLATIGNSFVRLKASGLDPLDGSLKALLDGVAAFGGGTQELQRAGIAIQQMAGKGVISMEELRQQLGEAIPFAMRVMAQQMKISVGQLIKQVERGELSARVGLKALFEGLANTFGGVSEAMVNTMAGAFERLKKVFQLGADRIFNTFKLGPKIAASLNIISDAVEKMIAGITQEDVDKWADFFIQAVFLAFRLGKMLVFVAGVVRTVLAPVIDAFNGVLDDLNLALLVIQNGFGLFGDSMEETVKKFNEGNKSIDGFSKNVKELAVSGMEELRAAMEKVKLVQDKLSLSPQGLKLSGALAKSLQGIQASLNAVETLPFEAKITRLRDKVNEFSKSLDEDSKRLGDLQTALNAALKETGGKITDEVQTLFTGITSLNEAINEGRDDVGNYTAELNKLRMAMQGAFAEKLDRQIEKISLKIRDMATQLSGTRLQKATAQLQRQFGSLTLDLEKQLDSAKKLPILTADRTARIFRLRAAIKSVNALEEDAIGLAKQRLDLEESLFLMKEKAGRATLKFDIESSRIELARLQSPTSAIFDTSLGDQVRDTKEALREQVVQIEIQAQIIRDTLTLETDPERAAALRERLALLKEQVPVLNAIAVATTETALLQRELWAEVGATIRETLGDAIKNLVKGTGTAKDALVAMFDRITDAAADYIAKLIVMKALQAGLGSGFGGSGGAIGGLLGFKNGGAFKGSIKPFANGDIVRGPTLFGLAGESGTEAIMPLERVGGKLGVRSVGGGDGGLNLTIQAIDQQSGADFLLRHLADIKSGFQNQKALNATGR